MFYISLTLLKTIQSQLEFAGTGFLFTLILANGGKEWELSKLQTAI